MCKPTKVIPITNCQSFHGRNSNSYSGRTNTFGTLLFASRWEFYSGLDTIFSHQSLDIMLLRTRSRAMMLSSLASKNFAFTPMRTFSMRKARKIPPTGSSGDRSTILGYLRELTSQFKKKKLLFRGAMVRPRLFRFTVPRFFTKRGAPSSYTIAYTWSNVAGHGSFLFLALSYLE